jgi:hypothetical protein
MDCGPENCPLTAWTALSPNERKGQRRPLARRLHEQGFSPEVIAEQFGVHVATIYRDLEFSHDAKIKPSKTARNPKGAGRPKGSKSTRKPGEVQKQRSINADPQAWARFKAKAEAEGKSAAEKLGEIIAEPVIDPATLSLSAQEKLAAAMRQHQRALDAQFQLRVSEEIRRRVDEIILPEWKRRIDEAKRIFNRRRGIMDKDTFNMIRRGLHPDSRKGISDQKLAAAFDAFMRLEKYLLTEVDSPTSFGGDLPSNLAEWDRMRAQRKAAKPAGATVARRR